MLPKFFKKEQIPHKSGIYIYKDKNGKIIYVGKAVDLFSRVSSYFSGRPHDLKTSQLVQNIAGFETIIVESEIEALILEANLIKKFKPLYNIRLTDDKDYLYIGVTKDLFPRILTGRKPDLKKFKKYYGPFPSSMTVKKTLKSLRRVFPWCLSKDFKKPCFYYHLNLCLGPCAKAISKDEYNQMINRFIKFMDGKKDELLEELNLEMERYSENLEYEKAAAIKKTILGINYVTTPTKITQYLENPNFLEDINKQSLEELQKVLNLEKLPERIEGYDISNIQGKEATGSMVVLTSGEIDKSQYRRFKIKITGKPNDYAMHQEMMRRRLKNYWPLPQLFIIDGGRGQVRASLKELEKRDVKIPIFGLAKRMEWLYPPEGEVIKLPKRSLALRALQKLRDESHRFAITYHRKLRAKQFLSK